MKFNIAQFARRKLTEEELAVLNKLNALYEEADELFHTLPDNVDVDTVQLKWAKDDLFRAFQAAFKAVTKA